MSHPTGQWHEVASISLQPILVGAQPLSTDCKAPSTALLSTNSPRCLISVFLAACKAEPHIDRTEGRAGSGPKRALLDTFLHARGTAVSVAHDLWGVNGNVPSVAYVRAALGSRLRNRALMETLLCQRGTEVDAQNWGCSSDS